jgi:hypothetical protein
MAALQRKAVLFPYLLPHLFSRAKNRSRRAKSGS